MNMPLIKENRIEMMIQNMECIDQYAFNRDSQKECILKLYPEKDEKSVFRGMVIPSLRHLGLIVGYGDLMRLSANGRLILEGKKIGDNELKRVLMAVFLEIDKERFQFIEEIKKDEKGNKVSVGYFRERMLPKIEATSKKQKEERILKWLKVLEQCGLVRRDVDILYVLKGNVNQAEKDVAWRKKSYVFRDVLFAAYASLSNVSAGVVDITDLRERSALEVYVKTRGILTEKQFDELLRSFPMVTDKYIISLGHPMGAEEKLFLYQGNYYRTINITEFKRGERK